MLKSYGTAASGVSEIVCGAERAAMNIDIVFNQIDETGVDGGFLGEAGKDRAILEPDFVADAVEVAPFVRRSHELIVGENDSVKRSVQFGSATDSPVGTERDALGEVAQDARVVAEIAGFGFGQGVFHFVGLWGLLFRDYISIITNIRGNANRKIKLSTGRKVINRQRIAIDNRLTI